MDRVVEITNEGKSGIFDIYMYSIFDISLIMNSITLKRLAVKFVIVT